MTEQAKAAIVYRREPQVITETIARTIFKDVAEVRLTLTLHEAQLVRALAGLVKSQEGNSALGILDALHGLDLPHTYQLDPETTIKVLGHRPPA